MKEMRSFSAWRRAAVVLLLGMATFTSLEASAQTQSQSQFAGIWRIEKPVTSLRTVEGKEPPLTADAAIRYREHLAARKKGDTSFDSATWCAAVGFPRIMSLNYPFEIMVRPQYVAFMHEWNWWTRVVYLDGALFDSPASAMGPPPGFGGPPPGGPPGAGGPPPGGPPMMMSSNDATGPMGLSKGRWEGEMLVVETTQLDDTKLLDNVGLPHSSQLKVTERLRLVSPNMLEARIRIEDPATFTQPWETLLSYRRQRGVNIQEDVCLDRIKTGAPAVKE